MAETEENKPEQLNTIIGDPARPVKQKRFYKIEIGKYSRQENTKSALDIKRLIDEYNDNKDNDNITIEPETKE
jgi:hypothetical protein